MIFLYIYFSVYRACPLNEEKPNCLKAAPVFPGKFKLLRHKTEVTTGKFRLM